MFGKDIPSHHSSLSTVHFSSLPLDTRFSMTLGPADGQVKQQERLERQIRQMETDVKRLWRRVQQLEASLIASGQAVPPPEE